MVDARGSVNSQGIIDQRHPNNGEGIVIVGMACRFPGAPNKQAYWHNLVNGVDAVREVPDERWNIQEYYDPRKGIKGKMYTKWGGFVDDVRRFDARFFDIWPREAEKMDPQQRFLLEVTWNALEDAGIVPSSLAGSNTGVFIGISTNDYARLLEDRESIDAFTGTGNALSIAANRLSYFYQLNGPSMVIDTACSSSLVALHQAYQSLRLGECDMAIVGGVNLILSPDLTISFSQAYMMASDGKCKTFDDRADGYVRGEGCGVIILKRLSDAQQNKDRSYAIIKGSAVNQDGRSNGLTAPSGPALEAVIRRSLQNAVVKPNEIGYIEAHGTGTSLGDPIEMNALKSVFGEGRSEDNPCYVGSVKTNIGHLEAAAGMAGLIKVALMLKHRQIVPHLHFQKMNRLINLEDSSINIPLKKYDWNSENTLWAGVNSFGFGGTNAHVTLSEVQEVYVKTSVYEWNVQVLTLSAKSKPALRQLAERYSRFINQNKGVDIKNLCYTSNCRREHFQERLAFPVENTGQLQERLQSFLKQDQSNLSNIVLKPFVGSTQKQMQQKKKSGRDKVVFLYSGQGTQYEKIADELFRSQPVFRQALIHCAKIVQKHNGMKLLDVLFGANKEKRVQIHQTFYTQPVLFAVQYALTQLWKSFGITPDIVMGHSIGEYAAACEAGILSVEDALYLVAKRGECIQSTSPDGQMVIIRTGEKRVQTYLQQYTSSDVAIAAVNAQDSVVVSGRKDQLKEVLQMVQKDGVSTSILNVSHAFHSPLMEPVLDSFYNYALQFDYKNPQLTFISNLTGLPLPEAPDAMYWTRHLRETVRFYDGLSYLKNEICINENCIFIEMGKHLLLSLIRRTFNSPQMLISSLDQYEHGEQTAIANGLAKLYEFGKIIDWEAFHAPYDHCFTETPGYAFNGEEYWMNQTNLTVATCGQLVANGKTVEGLKWMNILKQQATTIEKQSRSIHRYAKIVDREK